MSLESKFRSLKAREIERLLEQHYGELEHLGSQFYRLQDGRKLVFYAATDSNLYTPTAELLHDQLQRGDLVAFAYMDEEAAHLSVFAVPIEVFLGHVKQSGMEPTLSNATKYSLTLEHADRFRFHQLGLPLEDYQIISQPTEWTRGLVGLGPLPDSIVDHAGSLDVGQLERLLQWKLDGCEESGEEFNFVDIRRRLNAIRPELQLLVESPEEFTETSWKTVLDHMHSAQRPKNRILGSNPIAHVRHELQAFLVDSETDLAQRFEQLQKNLRYVGPSISGELISWYDPEQFPLENEAAKQGLRFFGFDPGATYPEFLTAFTQFREIYERLIGRLQPDLPLNLEIDQLFNQIHKVHPEGDGEKTGSDEPQGEAYWRITLPNQGQQATVWPTCLDKGIAAIGFRNRLEDYSQIQRFAEIKVGDWVVAFLREKRIGAIGQVTKAYDPQTMQTIPPDEDYWQGDFRRRIQVTWYPRDISVEQLSAATRNKFYTKTVLRLTPADFAEIREHYADLIDEGQEEEDTQPLINYTTKDFVQRTYQVDDKWYNEVIDLLKEKGQIVLYGPPGTGKTFLARELAKAITGLANPGPERYRLVQFHPAYSYEEFIEGIRPESRATNGQQVVEYPVRAGVFKRFCKDAMQQDCVFVIDEINRGNIASIFGELMYALEYRDDAAPVVLPYSGKEFTIPRNVYIIGTMNTADRSISLMDFALRRRFHFVRCSADPETLQRWAESRQIKVPYLLPLFRRLLDAIQERDYQIGMSYFMDDGLTEERLRRIWKHSIEPYLETYFIDDPSQVEVLRWDSSQLRDLRRTYDGSISG